MENKTVVAIIVGALIIGGAYYFTNRSPSESKETLLPTNNTQNGGTPPESSTPTITDCSSPSIKGNISSSGEKIYHVPGGQYYAVTQIDASKGEKWFCTEDEARAAGWRRSLR